LAGAAGFLLGGTLGALVELIVFHTLLAPSSNVVGAQTLPLGFTFGAALAPFLQARWGLRLPVQIRQRWWAATGFAALISGLAVTTGHLLLPPAMLTSAFGAELNAAAAVILSLILSQWLVLYRSNISRSWLWLVAIPLWLISLPLGWAGGIFFGMPLSMMASIVVGGIARLIVAATMVIVAGVLATLLTAPLLGLILKKEMQS
jgi:hypothetical protein